MIYLYSKASNDLNIYPQHINNMNKTESKFESKNIFFSLTIQVHKLFFKITSLMNQNPKVRMLIMNANNQKSQLKTIKIN